MREAFSTKPGDVHDEVSYLQDLLLKAGYYQGGITRTYDALTAAAVQAFQVANELPDSGECDPVTWSVLEGPHVTFTAQAGNIW